jgi:hypothetical protein
VVLEEIPFFLALHQMVAVAVVEMPQQQMAQVVVLVAEPEGIYPALVVMEILLPQHRRKEITVGQLLQVHQLMVQAVGVERLQMLKMEVAPKAVMEETVRLVVLLEVLLPTLEEVVVEQI